MGKFRNEKRLTGLSVICILPNPVKQTPKDTTTTPSRKNGGKERATNKQNLQNRTGAGAGKVETEHRRRRNRWR
jgi:hypothetical protein